MIPLQFVPNPFKRVARWEREKNNNGRFSDKSQLRRRNRFSSNVRDVPSAKRHLLCVSDYVNTKLVLYVLIGKSRWRQFQQVSEVNPVPLGQLQYANFRSHYIGYRWNVSKVVGWRRPSWLSYSDASSLVMLISASVGVERVGRAYIIPSPQATHHRSIHLFWMRQSVAPVHIYMGKKGRRAKTRGPPFPRRAHVASHHHLRLASSSSTLCENNRPPAYMIFVIISDRPSSRKWPISNNNQVRNPSVELSFFFFLSFSEDGNRANNNRRWGGENE